MSCKLFVLLALAGIGTGCTGLKGDSYSSGDSDGSIDGSTQSKPILSRGGTGGADGSGTGASSGSSPDAGKLDGGSSTVTQPNMDAGSTRDADGSQQPDAGQPDAGNPDVGNPDAGQPDAGRPDAGPTVAERVCARWQADRADRAEGSWSGDVASCNAGDMAAQSRANALRLTNLYRWLVGLPETKIEAGANPWAQQCALMMQANGMLSRSPPETWACWTRDGHDTAADGLLATSPAVGAIDLYMVNPGAMTRLEGRRWLLSNYLSSTGFGGTDRYSCMWLSGAGKVAKAWVAWPPEGAVPLEAFKLVGSRLDYTGWSIQSDTIDLEGAEIAVTANGASLPVTITQLEDGYGSRYALRFTPMGWLSEAGLTYEVRVTGTNPMISYDVTVVDCDALP